MIPLVMFLALKSLIVIAPNLETTVQKTPSTRLPKVS